MVTKTSRVALLISDKIKFKLKIIKRYKEGNYIMIKGSILQEDMTIVNICVPNIRAPKHRPKYSRAERRNR